MINTKNNTIFCYIEFHNDKLVLAIFTKKNNVLAPSNQTVIPLENKEYFDNAIYNPTTISKHIKTFIQKHPKTTEALVTLPDYEMCQETHQRFFLLQVALCVSRSGIPIHSIISHSLTTENNSKLPSHDENLFSLFIPPPQSSPYQWLTHTAVAVCITLFMIMLIQRRVYNQTHTLFATIVSLKKDNEHLEHKTHDLHDLNKKHGELKTTNDKLSRYSKMGGVLPSVLEALSTTIPPTTWLKRVYIFPLQGTPQTLEIEGYTRSVKEISLFIRKLKNTHSITNLKLASLQGALDQKNHLLFKLTGVVPTEKAQQE